MDTKERQKCIFRIDSSESHRRNAVRYMREGSDLDEISIEVRKGLLKLQKAMGKLLDFDREPTIEKSFHELRLYVDNIDSKEELAKVMEKQKHLERYTREVALMDKRVDTDKVSQILSKP